MHSSLIGKIEKARRYAQQPERVQFTRFTATFNGENDAHEVSYDAGAWKCSCEFFAGWDVCCHTMAIERMLGMMLPKTESRQEDLIGAR